jgi:hypothetical protein
VVAVYVPPEGGCRAVRELGRTVALLRSDDEATIPPPVTGFDGIPALVQEARAGGLEADFRTSGDLGGVEAGVRCICWAAVARRGAS